MALDKIVSCYYCNSNAIKNFTYNGVPVCHEHMPNVPVEEQPPSTKRTPNELSSFKYSVIYSESDSDELINWFDYGKPSSFVIPKENISPVKYYVHDMESNTVVRHDPKYNIKYVDGWNKDEQSAFILENGKITKIEEDVDRDDHDW